MTKYRKLPIEIEAMRFLGGQESGFEIIDWARQYHTILLWNVDHEMITIPTLEGIMFVSKGDWVIKGINNEFYPCKNNIFVKTYEEI